jgi:hypothetical protein
MPSRLILQLQIVPAHNRSDLAYLVWLCLTPKLLQGEDLNDTRPGEYAVAAPAANRETPAHDGPGGDCPMSSQATSCQR